MRRHMWWGSAAALALVAAIAAPVPAAAATAARVPSRAPAPVSLDQLFDNRAVSDDDRPGDADFDGSGASLSAGDLAAAGWTPGRSLTVEGARLTWPRRTAGEPDNVRADGQSVRLRGRGDALAFLVAGTGGAPAGGAGTVRYRDGSRGTYRLTAPDWRLGSLATKAVALPHVNTPDGQLAERAKLYVVTVPLIRGREVESVALPRDAGPDLHVFALSVRTATTGWTGTWSASTATYATVGPWTDRTLRLVAHTSVGGPRVRIHFDNTFASAPVRIGSATVAVRGTGAGARSAPVRLTFGGGRGTEVPAGAQAFSDPLAFRVEPDSDLLVSFHLPGTVTAAPLHREAVQASYVSGPGDHTADAGGDAYPSTITTWPLLAGIDVSGGPGSVVLLGDSITDGARSTQGANRRWPNVLATRLLNQRDVPRYGVLNQGISANRVVADRYPGDGVSTDSGGVSALHRLDRDVFAQPSARTVIVFQGVNDVRWGTSADDVIAGLREIAGRAHARGLRVLAATIAPCAGESLCTPDADARRTAINAYLRDNGGDFDAVLDFDRVLRDPAQPSRILPAYDSGDHLHPGDAGLAALADSVDLRQLRP
ncbi:SGNH/GDSL hydrolase family protein [Streptomyces sp. NPDC058001]|uniref:SGNH/GDSL hydrolase family protein n=1 Tax=Streptomyces sp. NPDC058001 TaxID=3346300 RepID=UPI0036EA6AC2